MYTCQAFTTVVVPVRGPPLTDNTLRRRHHVVTNKSSIGNSSSISRSSNAKSFRSSFVKHVSAVENDNHNDHGVIGISATKKKKTTVRNVATDSDAAADGITAADADRSSLSNNNILASWTSFLRSSLSQKQKSAMTWVAAALIMASVLLAPLQDALAAPSGGRMGGSFGGSSSSNSRQSYSRSYSTPMQRSGSSNYARGFSQGYSSGYFSRPSVTVVPSIGGSYGYNYGVFGAPVLSPGVTVVSRGPSIVDFLIFGFFATVLFRTFTSNLWDNSSSSDDSNVFTSSSASALGPGVTVAQISVAVRVPNRSDPSNILNFLDRLSQTARTDSRVGISNLVSQVALELLRQKRSIFAADTEYKHFQNRDSSTGAAAQREFMKRAIQERSKFEKEGTSKYGGVDYSSSFGDPQGSSSLLSPGMGDGYYSPQATNAVVTLLISIDGDSTKLPKINSMSDVENALTRLATDVKVDECLRSAEVLWTPENRKDVLLDRDIYVDYPKLRSV